MKAGLTTSVVLHAALIGFGLISLSAPKPFEVVDVESLPVDIIPIEQLTQIQQGDKKAPVNDKPTPKETQKTETVPDAREGRRKQDRYRQEGDARGDAQGSRGGRHAEVGSKTRAEAGRPEKA